MGGELRRRYSSNRPVRSCLVVALTPDGNDLADGGQGFEPVLIEAFAPEPAVEALGVGVLGGFARLDQDMLEDTCLHPGNEGSAGELWSIAGLLRLRPAKPCAR
jgi:hypothetical protein